MKKFFYQSLSLFLLVGAIACKKENPIKDDLNGTGDGPKKELSVDEQKDYFDNSVASILGYFNVEDQRRAIELAEYFAEEFDKHEWDFEEFEDFYDSNYDLLFRQPAYIGGLLQMKGFSDNPIYSFSFANDAMIFEANTANRIVRNLGKSKDNKYTVILRDGSRILTTQVWGEGKETTYLVNGEDYGGRKKFYEAKLPEKIYFSFKENDFELIKCAISLDIVKDKHAITSVEVKITSLSFTFYENLNSTSAQFAMSFKNNQNVILAMSVNLPSFPVLIKKGKSSWSQWFDLYGNQWESLVKQMGGANFIVNIGDCVQIKGNADNGGKFYTELRNLLESHENEKMFWRKMATIINENAKCGMYFNSDKKQADIKMDVVLKDGYYLALPLLFFSDGSSYDLSSYFSERSVWKNYLRQVDNLLIDYENLFRYWDMDYRLNY